MIIIGFLGYKSTDSYTTIEYIYEPTNKLSAVLKREL